MIYLKTDEEIELMREANQLVGKTLGELAKHIAPGVSTLQLDKIAEAFIRDHGAVPAFLGYGGFPGSLCTSINDVVVHGIPSDKIILKEGDVISVDCGTTLNGFTGDSAYTFCVGEVAPEVKELLKTTKESLYLGIQQAVEGKRIGDIAYAVQTYCESKGYSVVRELVGHGIGREMHEEPEVPNYGRRGYGPLLRNGMCICIEPMINLGRRNVVIEKDGWTVRTKDNKCSAHFEHCIAIRPEGPQILSSFDYLEEVLGNNAI
ncbi:type I methionyl aminopeptidase [Parabacteroides sp. 52]|uniref:type I methionyl aminopeptidase n=1 Tax=unclassified Parabacteroides TaxID=2649774 RepID=UPI0013D7CFE0|nr:MULTISPECIES: type I methionyl aminopeptidase [unclassified Parabacteroides]MDH6535363.1 methionyl aminopeptidase [Parabacteroides sp. PM5-20]NDV56009.1 type I methionyl aminopeptidase [Parabacteroides sp. 52]